MERVVPIGPALSTSRPSVIILSLNKQSNLVPSQRRRRRGGGSPNEYKKEKWMVGIQYDGDARESTNNFTIEFLAASFPLEQR